MENTTAQGNSNRNEMEIGQKFLEVIEIGETSTASAQQDPPDDDLIIELEEVFEFLKGETDTDKNEHPPKPKPSAPPAPITVAATSNSLSDGDTTYNHWHLDDDLRRATIPVCLPNPGRLYRRCGLTGHRRSGCCDSRILFFSKCGRVGVTSRDSECIRNAQTAYQSLPRGRALRSNTNCPQCRKTIN